MTTPRTRLAALAATAATVTATLGTVTLTGPPAHAAATDVVITELMYHAASDLDGDDFLELTNTGTTPVDLSGWTFSGITLTVPTGTTIAPGARLVMAKDPTQFQTRYGFAPAAGYGGNLSNSGETVALKDATGTTIDTVTYATDDPWPVRADGTGPSLELIDPTLDNNDPLNWAAATNTAGHTAGAPNSVRRTGLGPRITNVTPSTTTPAPGQDVTITATITGHTTATLRYRTDFGAEQTTPMTNTTGDTHTATIPGAAAGHLLRYRVEATNPTATTRSPRTDDTINYRGIVVPHGLSSPVPVLEWFISNADYTTMVNNPTADITRPAVLAYDGVVYDNVEANIKGNASQRDPKVSWKFHMPQNHDLDMPGVITEPVDEFDMQADWSDKSHGRAILAWDAYQRAGIVNHQMFPIRSQRNGAFQGLYTFNEVFDGTWREREGYDDKELFEAETSAFNQSRPVTVRFSKKTPDDGNFAPIASFVNGVALTGTAQRDFLLANADLPKMLNYAAVTAIVEHVDSSSKNFLLSLNPNTGRWKIIPWDLDHTFSNGCCNVESSFVTPAEPGDNTSALMRALLAVPEWRQMYFRRVRTLVNDLLATGRMEALYDAVVGPAQPVGALDFGAWPYPAGTTFATFRQRLFTDIQDRRNAFNSDPRVPGNQPAAPNIVINEIQHSPTGGDTAEFLELYNPHTQAIDLSGWTFTGIDLTIQPGTVILPGQTMTFVADDPTFRTTYGHTVFVGDRYDDNLPTAGTLTLTRPDGTLADTVTYGGTAWPTSTTGQSLELTNPTADNNDPASWALSTGQGTPGTTTVTGPVITAPAAPTNATATPGNTTATLTWTAPTTTGGAPLTGYTIRVTTTTGTQVGALRTAPPTATSLTITGLTNGTGYRFQVAATNEAGTSPYSPLTTTVTPTNTATAPGAPTIGTPVQGATGTPLTATARWTPPTTTGGSAITGYQVTALRMSSTAPDATVLGRTTSRVLGPGVRQREFTLTAGTYRFEVVAINAIGTSPPSNRSAAIAPR